MKKKKPRRGLMDLILAIGIAVAVILMLSLVSAALISAGMIPQTADVICSAVTLAIAVFVGVQVAVRRTGGQRWAAAAITAAGIFMIQMIANLCIPGRNMELILLNSIILFAVTLLALLPGRNRKKGYKIKY